MSTSAMIGPRSLVIVRDAPGRLAPYKGRTGTVVHIDAKGGIIADVDIDGEIVAVPLPYLAPEPREKQPRRSPLTLSGPPDDRDEAQRLADGVKALESLPAGPDGRRRYTVIRIGQGKDAAICHACSRRDRERGGNGMVRIHCKDCGSQGYAPSTNSTAGAPDTIFWRADWPKGIACMAEWKIKAAGKRTAEQKALEAAQRIFVVWDTPSFFEAVYAADRAIGVQPHPQLRAFVEEGAAPSQSIASTSFRAE